MQPLATAFDDRLYHYGQVAREHMLAIYQQVHKHNPQVVRYEVVKIRVSPAHTWPTGLVSPEREVYPGSSAWGRDGWTFFTLADAQAFLRQLRATNAPSPVGESESAQEAMP